MEPSRDSRLFAKTSPKPTLLRQVLHVRGGDPTRLRGLLWFNWKSAGAVFIMLVLFCFDFTFLFSKMSRFLIPPGKEPPPESKNNAEKKQRKERRPGEPPAKQKRRRNGEEETKTRWAFARDCCSRTSVVRCAYDASKEPTKSGHVEVWLSWLGPPARCPFSPLCWLGGFP